MLFFIFKISIVFLLVSSFLMSDNLNHNYFKVFWELFYYLNFLLVQTDL